MGGQLGNQKYCVGFCTMEVINQGPGLQLQHLNL